MPRSGGTHLSLLLWTSMAVIVSYYQEGGGDLGEIGAWEDEGPLAISKTIYDKVVAHILDYLRTISQSSSLVDDPWTLSRIRTCHELYRP